MNERIKKTRQNANLSMRSFADRIGITAPSVARLESGENNPSEQTIRAICSEFQINRQWLESGIGPMYMQRDEDDEIIDQVLSGEDDFIKAVIRGIAKTPGGWEKMREVFCAIQAEINRLQTDSPSPHDIDDPDFLSEIRKAAREEEANYHSSKQNKDPIAGA